MTTGLGKYLTVALCNRRNRMGVFLRIASLAFAWAIAPAGARAQEDSEQGSSGGVAAVGTKHMLVSSFMCAVPNCSVEDAVIKYNLADGAYVGSLVTGIQGPYGMVVHPLRGTLLVVSRDQSTVREYNATTGALIRTLIQPGAEGLHFPQNILVGQNGNLLVTSTQTAGNLEKFNGILEFNIHTGAFVRNFVDGGFILGSTCGDTHCLRGPNGMAFGNNNNLLVTSSVNHMIIEYNGLTGAYVGNFDSSKLENPSGILVRPATMTRPGNILATSTWHNPALPSDTDKVVEFSPTTRELMTTQSGVLASGMVDPGPMYWHEDGTLLVGDRLLWNVAPQRSDKVQKRNALTGAYVTNFTPTADGHLHWSTAILQVNAGWVTSDYNVDAKVDMKDVAEFQKCFGAATPSQACLNAFDDNLTKTIDQADYAALRTRLLGP